MDQNTFVTTTNESIVIKDAYKDVKLVVMPESGVTTIGLRAFLNCTALSSITIPNSVTTIVSGAFVLWINTQTIYIRASSKPAGWDADWKSSCNAKIVWGYTGN